MAPMAEFTTSDTCARCGLRRLTLALEQRGIIIRLCDDCFWGNQPAKPAEKLPAAAQGKGDNGEGNYLSPVQWGPLDDLSTLRESMDELCEIPFTFTYRWRSRALAAGQPPCAPFSFPFK
jgi:hypothetical protein